jgi:sugar lactone lactonase YvrE
MNLNLTTSRIHTIISLIFIIISTNFLFSQSKEWIGFTSGNFILSFADEGNYIWIGTAGGGLVKLNKSTGEFIVYDKWNSGLPDNFIWSIAIDKQGNKWIGTPDGLAKFDGVNWTVYNTSNSGLPYNWVHAIAIDGGGNKWIGTSLGLAKFDGVNWTVYKTSNSGLPDNFVMAIAIDGGGNKWIGTFGGGLAKFDGVNWTVYKTSNSGLPDNYVRAIVVDGQGNKWIGTDDGGLAVYREGGVIIPPVEVKEKSNEIPTNFALYQNYPNPFNPSTTIEFDIPEKTNVKLIIYDILGREVETLIDKELEPGKYKINYTATNLPTGIYFYTLKTPKFTKTNKMLLIK